jgi:flagellar hook-basal body complex protein FliE
MSMPITNTTPFNPPVITLDSPTVGRTGSAGATKTESADGNDFISQLRGAIKDMNAAPKAGEDASQDYASGKQNDIHGTMISMAQADISLRLISNIRSRVIEAYREVMRMGA